MGAFACGVFKALAKRSIRVDIVAGTSIGGVNAAIIAGSKDAKHPERLLEQFWLELSESFVDFDKVTFPSASMPKVIEHLLLPYTNFYHYFPTATSKQEENYYSLRADDDSDELAIRMKQVKIFATARLFLEMIKCLSLDGGRNML